jgi:hypothetical protein
MLPNMYILHYPSTMSEVEVQHVQSHELIASLPATKRSDEVPTAEIYRLYKRRWVGVFAMVSKQLFFRMGFNYMLTLYAMDSLCSRLWPLPVGHGLVPYPTRVRLFLLSRHRSFLNYL